MEGILTNVFTATMVNTSLDEGRKKFTVLHTPMYLIMYIFVQPSSRLQTGESFQNERKMITNEIDNKNNMLQTTTGILLT